METSTGQRKGRAMTAGADRIDGTEMIGGTERIDGINTRHSVSMMKNPIENV